MWAAIIAGYVLALALGAGVWYYRSRYQAVKADLTASRASTEVLRKTVHVERAARKEAETARNQALREKWRTRVETAEKVETHEDADAALAAAAERLRRN